MNRPIMSATIVGLAWLTACSSPQTRPDQATTTPASTTSKSTESPPSPSSDFPGLHFVTEDSLHASTCTGLPEGSKVRGNASCATLASLYRLTQGRVIHAVKDHDSASNVINTFGDGKRWSCAALTLRYLCQTSEGDTLAVPKGEEK